MKADSLAVQQRPHHRPGCHVCWIPRAPTLGSARGSSRNKLETAYPQQFCKHFVSLLLQHLTQKGCRDGLNLLEGDPANSSGARVVTTQAKTKRAASFQVIPGICRRCIAVHGTQMNKHGIDGLSCIFGREMFSHI